MSNADVARELIELRELQLSGGLTSEQVVSEFERLTYRLTGVDSRHERRLVTFVNDLERIPFTRLPENQGSEMAPVLADAQAVFDFFRSACSWTGFGLPSTRHERTGSEVRSVAAADALHSDADTASDDSHEARTDRRDAEERQPIASHGVFQHRTADAEQYRPY